MSSNDRTLLLAVPLVAALVAFWFLALSPKRDDVKKLDAQIEQLHGSIDQQQASAQGGEQARKSFPRDYQHLVVMGKAVPVDDQTASLLVQINRVAESSDVSFRAITLSQDSSSGTAAAAPSTSTAGTTTTTAPATESAAALLPIGATVGSAGLPVLPYELTFRGTYFQIADFMAGIDNLVKSRKGTIAADGRLVTIDGFSFTADDSEAFPMLKATLNVTTFVTPAGQGLTAGASPAGPAAPPATPEATQAASTTTPATP
jgi:Tfp pilus assembly protein PilO